MRQYLAWSSIWGDRESLNLDQFQSRQAETKRTGADETVDARIPEAFQWLLVPGQSDPKGTIEWAEFRLQGQESLAARAAKKLKGEERLVVQLGGIRLRHELDRVPLWRDHPSGDKPHVGVKQLCEDMARYLYLPRIRDDDVLLGAVKDGLAQLTWQSETFAYAEGWDEQRGRYKGLKGGVQTRVMLDGDTLVVKPDIAAAQIAADRAAIAEQSSVDLGTAAIVRANGAASSTVATPGVGQSAQQAAVESARQLRRFHGSVTINPIRLGRDASRIAEEVVQHLASIVGSNVDITLEIHCELPDGASEKLLRDVTENCRTLGFKTYGFEQE